MATNLDLDDELIEKAVVLGGHRSKKDAVNQALREYVSQLKRIEALESFGTFEFEPEYDYKQARQR